MFTKMNRRQPKVEKLRVGKMKKRESKRVSEAATGGVL